MKMKILNFGSCNIDYVYSLDHIVSPGETETTYKMETISKVGITEFLKNFNTTKFKCTNKEYHKETEKISYIQITQQYE